MKKLILTILILNSFLFSSVKEINASYEITYGSFLNLGVANASLKIFNKKEYEISIEAKATGLAKFLSNGRVEVYKSKGILENGIFVPTLYSKEKKDNLKAQVTTYSFNSRNKEISINEVRYGKNITFNTQLEPQYVDFKTTKNFTLDYFAKNDLLSLFFNFKNLYATLEKDKIETLHAVGANKTDGSISIMIPTNQKDLDEYLKTNSKIKFTASINQNIFESEKGELLISINDKGFCDYAVLKDVLFFGDIVGVMKKIKFEEK